VWLQGQTRQHARLLCLLGVRQLCVGVNKMDCDVAGYKEERYKEIKDEMKHMLTKARALRAPRACAVALGVCLSCNRHQLAALVSSAAASSCSSACVLLSGLLRSGVSCSRR
jgi:hypothetical protein